jgi:hypothetical protein
MQETRPFEEWAAYSADKGLYAIQGNDAFSNTKQDHPVSGAHRRAL